MENPGKSVRMSGSGVVAGGSYEAVKGSGSMRIEGDVAAHRVDISGSMTSNGSIKADQFDVSGSVRVEGDIEILDGKGSGSMTVRGDLRVGRSASFSGSLSVD